MRKWIISMIILFSIPITGCSNVDEVKLQEKKEVAPLKHVSQTATRLETTKTTSDQKIIKDEITSIVPERIEIPSIGVKTAIEQVGTLKNGQMGVPKDIDQVGWYKDGAKPGERGSAVFAGHVDGKKGPAVFYHLKDVKNGDQIIVTDQDGKSLVFEVKRKKAYPRQEAPVDDIFGFTYRKTLKLITCTGHFNHEAKTHEERLVVYTELVGSE